MYNLTTNQMNDLRSSGLSDQTIEAAGLYRVDGIKAGKALRRNKGSPDPLLVTPFKSKDVAEMT